VSRTIRRDRRRNHFGIIADILASAVNGTSKTHLMYDAKLSYAQLKKYTSQLVKLKLLKITARAKPITYETTEKGKSFLEIYRELDELLKPQ
jgi:predicted transcriptional regulator